MNTPLPDIANLRQDYRLASLDEHDVARDPLDQFGRWFQDAVRAQLPEPNAMTLATVGPGGRPAARTVLLKGLEGGGFVFYTNYGSAKAQEIERQPQAALLFFWGALERQVRIEGTLGKVSAAESDEYYRKRPLGSRIGAWASPQSRVIESRAWLEARMADYAQRLGDDPARPPHWGGYRMIADTLEFWQGRTSRLHDRIRYRRDGGGWIIERIAP